MDASAPTGRHISFEEYLELERSGEIRHEYYQGEIFAMSGGSKNHNRLVRNMARILEDEFLPQGCDVFSENVKLEVIPKVYYPYPDIILVCESGESEDAYIARNPRLLVEVTSPNTEANDRGFKLRRYQKIPSLRYYLIVSQSDYLVDVYGRQSPNHLWTYRLYEGKDTEIELQWLDLRFDLHTLYQYVDFGQPDEE